jgi:hypothetical protein
MTILRVGKILSMIHAFYCWTGWRGRWVVASRLGSTLVVRWPDTDVEFRIENKLVPFKIPIWALLQIRDTPTALVEGVAAFWVD